MGITGRLPIGTVVLRVNCSIEILGEEFDYTYSDSTSELNQPSASVYHFTLLLSPFRSASNHLSLVSHKKVRIGRNSDRAGGRKGVCSMRRDVWHLPGEGRDLAVRRLFSVLRFDFGHLIFALLGR